MAEWIKVADRGLSLSTGITGLWAKVAETTTTITSITGAWVKVAEATTTIASSVTGTWVKVAETSLAIIASISTWVKVASLSLSVKPSAQEPPLPVVTNIPWGPIAIVGGAVLVGAAVSKKKGRP